MASDPFQMRLQVFLHFAAMMIKDQRNGRLDPFLTKVIGKKPAKQMG